MSQQAPILVVEDDAAIQSAMCDALALTGYPVVTADHGGIALEIVQRQTVAMIFLDMKMPVMDGWAFVREYRARSISPAPIVMMTAARDEAARAAEIDAIAYLAKPFELDELLVLVNRHVNVMQSGPA